MNCKEDENYFDCNHFGENIDGKAEFADSAQPYNKP